MRSERQLTAGPWRRSRHPSPSPPNRCSCAGGRQCQRNRMFPNTTRTAEGICLVFHAYLSATPSPHIRTPPLPDRCPLTRCWRRLRSRCRLTLRMIFGFAGLSTRYDEQEDPGCEPKAAYSLDYRRFCHPEADNSFARLRVVLASHFVPVGLFTIFGVVGPGTVFASRPS